jgi:hypothetical protein
MFEGAVILEKTYPTADLETARENAIGFLRNAKLTNPLPEPPVNV